MTGLGLFEEAPDRMLARETLAVVKYRVDVFGPFGSKQWLVSFGW